MAEQSTPPKRSVWGTLSDYKSNKAAKLTPGKNNAGGVRKITLGQYDHPAQPGCWLRANIGEGSGEGSGVPEYNREGSGEEGDKGGRGEGSGGGSAEGGRRHGRHGKDPRMYRHVSNPWSNRSMTRLGKAGMSRLVCRSCDRMLSPEAYSKSQLRHTIKQLQKSGTLKQRASGPTPFRPPTCNMCLWMSS